MMSRYILIGMFLLLTGCGASSSSSSSSLVDNAHLVEGEVQSVVQSKIVLNNYPVSANSVTMVAQGDVDIYYRK